MERVWRLQVSFSRPAGWWN